MSSATVLLLSNVNGISSFFLPFALARTFSVILNRNVDSRRSCFVPEVIGAAFGFHCKKMMLNVASS